MSSAPSFLDWLCAQYDRDERCNKGAQIEAPIESIGKSSQIVLAIRAVPERTERAHQRRFQIAEHSVDPLELGQVAWFEVAHHRGQVNTTRIGHHSKAPQAVAGHVGIRHQAGLGLFGDGLGRETTDQIGLDVQRLAVAVHRGGSHRRHLAPRASSGPATQALTAQIRVVQLHGATYAVDDVPLSRRAVGSSMQLME